MTAIEWIECDRRTLTEVLPEALVVVPLGAVEQHGPHLPTGTDSMIVRSIARRAADRAAAALDTRLVITPQFWVGASDHHLPFGGTLTLSAETVLAVLRDILDSIAAAGATRTVLVNGHGGNSGLCHAAAAAASTRSGMAVTHLDYWQLLPASCHIGPVPGHAGTFETAIMLSLRPDLALPIPDRAAPPSVDPPPGTETHSAAIWAGIDGYTDHPERATSEAGAELVEALIAAMSQTFIRLMP